MELTEIQQLYFDKVVSQELKDLLSNSYMLFSMSDDERDDYLIWMSLIHQDEAQEAKVLAVLQEEADFRDKALADPKSFKLTKSKQSEQVEKIEADYSKMKQTLVVIKKEAQKEMEVDDKQESKKEMASLLDKLKKA